MIRDLCRLRSRAAALVLLVALSGCAWQRVGTEESPNPTVDVPKLFDAIALYREMGLFTHGAPLPFAGTIRFLAAATPDSTLAVFGLSMANNAFAFDRVGNGFEAKYRVNVTFEQDGQLVGEITSEDTVRVATFRETLRPDESVIFQKFVALPPGPTTAKVTVRNVLEASDTAVSQDQRSFDVPRIGPGAVSSLVPVYQGGGRATLDTAPRFVLNPRAMAPFGAAPLKFYVEAYGTRDSTTARVRVIGGTGTVAWSGVVQLTPRERFAAGTVVIPPDSLPVGEVHVEAVVPSLADTVSTRALVSFSDQWVTTNLNEVLSMLRYFGHEHEISAIRKAPPDQQLALWRQFWRDTDPTPVTPQNEALDRYFGRLQEANARFQENGEPGWLTDRGEVLITLGEPDETFDASSVLQSSQRIIRWNYTAYRLTIDFVDETGFGRFRMTPSSRSDYERVLNRVRREGE